MFTQRTNTPNNSYYNRPTNPCIIGNYPKGTPHRTGFNGCDVLPNCTGYATGRFNEIAGEKGCKWLGNTDAKNYIQLAKSQGLKVGMTPALGACIVWSTASHGHVAIVEEVISDTEIKISQSGWSSSLPMWTGIHRKGANGNWVEGYDYRWMRNGYTFIGFIYQPKEVVEMTQEEFNKMADTYLASLALKPASGYAKEGLDWAKAEKIMSGDTKGNMMPKSLLSREDFAIMLKRALGK